MSRVEFTSTEQNSETFDYGLEDSIPMSDINDAARMRANGLGSYDPEHTATETLTNLILLGREIRVAAMVQDPTSYPSANRQALSGTDQFSNPNSDIIGTVKGCFENLFVVRPNTIAMGREVWGKISSHPQLVNAIKGNLTSKGIVSPDNFQKLFEGEGLKQVLIGEAFINVSRPGQPAVINRVWGKSMMFSYIDPAARPEGGTTLGMTAEYGKRVAGSYEDKTSVWMRMVVRVGDRVREIITAPEAGYLLQNVVD